MKEIRLTRSKTTLVDDGLYDELQQYKWFCTNEGYAARQLRRAPGERQQTVRMHRIIMCAQVGEVVDHINGDKLDNRRCNLRICSNAQNCQNQGLARNNTSGYKGVSWDRSAEKWMAYIYFDGGRKTLGRFKEKEEAARAYDAAALQLFGEFARLNFPEAA